MNHEEYEKEIPSLRRKMRWFRGTDIVKLSGINMSTFMRFKLGKTVDYLTIVKIYDALTKIIEELIEDDARYSKNTGGKDE